MKFRSWKNNVDGERIFSHVVTGAVCFTAALLLGLFIGRNTGKTEIIMQSAVSKGVYYPASQQTETTSAEQEPLRELSTVTDTAAAIGVSSQKGTSTKDTTTSVDAVPATTTSVSSADTSTDTSGETIPDRGMIPESTETDPSEQSSEVQQDTTSVTETATSTTEATTAATTVATTTVQTTKATTVKVTTTQGIVNINTAGNAALESLPGIGEVKAQSIIDYRNQNGPFKSVDDLINVSGIGKKTLEKLRPWVTVGG